MKKILPSLLLACLLAATAAGQTPATEHEKNFNDYLSALDLRYQPPSGFIPEFTEPRPFYLQAATRNLFHGTFFTLTAENNQEVLIYTYLMNVEPDPALARMFPGFSPGKNWINVLKAHADTLNSRITFYSPEETRALNADTAGVFDLVAPDSPYKGLYPKARVVFFNKAGQHGNHIDVVLYYFYKDGVDVDAYIRRTKHIFLFNSEI